MSDWRSSIHSVGSRGTNVGMGGMTPSATCGALNRWRTLGLSTRPLCTSLANASRCSCNWLTVCCRVWTWVRKSNVVAGGNEATASSAQRAASNWRKRSLASSSNLDSAVRSASNSASRLSERRMKSWVDVIFTFKGGAWVACLAFSNLDFRASTAVPVESFNTSRAFSNLKILFCAASRAASKFTLTLADLNVGWRGCAVCTELGTGDLVAPARGHCSERGLGPRTIWIQPTGTSAVDHPLRGMSCNVLRECTRCKQHTLTDHAKAMAASSMKWLEPKWQEPTRPCWQRWCLCIFVKPSQIKWIVAPNSLFLRRVVRDINLYNVVQVSHPSIRRTNGELKLPVGLVILPSIPDRRMLSLLCFWTTTQCVFCFVLMFLP